MYAVHSVWWLVRCASSHMCEDHAVYDESFTLIFFILSLAWVRQYSVCQIIYTTPTLHAHTHTHSLAPGSMCAHIYSEAAKQKKERRVCWTEHNRTE